MTRLAGSWRAAGWIAVGLAIAATAACGDDAGASATWVPAASAAPATGAPTRLAQVTAACKLLPAKTLVDILGGSTRTELAAREDAVEKLAAGKRRYTCAYGRDGQEPFALVVSTRPDQAEAAKSSVDAMAEASGVKNTRFTVGDVNGVGYVKDGFRIVGLALPYKKELRVVVFTAPELVPHAKLVEVAEHVVPQL